MQLSKRLQMSANFVTRHSRVADVGCDHAYMSIYLMQQGIAKQVIAMDVNQGPLMRARENIAKYGYADQIETRLSDGTRQLKVDEVDTILCAGMGGPLMIHVLSVNLEATLAVKEWILQPQSEIHEVRCYIREQGFVIVDEQMCEEDGKFYTAIHAVRNDLAEEFIEQRELQNDAVSYDGYWRERLIQSCGIIFGESLLRRKDPVLYEYLKREEALTRRILNSLQGQDTKNAQVRRDEIEGWLKMLGNALLLWKKEGADG